MFNRSYQLFLAVCCFLFSSLCWAQEKSLLDQFLRELDTFSAAFEQRLLNEAGEELDKSIGVVYLKQPGKFHWAYIDPYSQFLISDGRTLWIYDEDLEQVTIRDITESIEDSPAAILTGEIDINKHYVLIELGESGGNKWLELTPRDIESQYQSVQLGFYNNQLTKMTLFDGLGQTTSITFLDTKRNSPLEDSLFQFLPPEDTDIIDSRNSTYITSPTE